MKILISIILNALILYALYYFLWASEKQGLWAGIEVHGGYVAFIAWWVVLWLINAFIKPILNLLALPFWLASLIVNGITLWLLQYVLNDFLQIADISYKVNWWFDFIVAVAIFSILNIIYTLILNK